MKSSSSQDKEVEKDVKERRAHSGLFRSGRADGHRGPGATGASFISPGAFFTRPALSGSVKKSEGSRAPQKFLHCESLTPENKSFESFSTSSVTCQCESAAHVNCIARSDSRLCSLRIRVDVAEISSHGTLWFLQSVPLRLWGFLW
ncbi:unnamed protein product [Leuciscus chuanchicus]